VRACNADTVPQGGLVSAACRIERLTQASWRLGPWQGTCECIVKGSRNLVLLAQEAAVHGRPAEQLMSVAHGR